MTVPGRRLRVTDLDGDGAYDDVEPGLLPDDTNATTAVDSKVMIARLPGDREPGERGIDRVEVVVDGWRFRFKVEDAQRARLRDRARRAASDHGPQTPATVRAQLPGRVVSVAVATGDVVALGQRLMAIEAMKMENDVRAPRAGRVEMVAVSPGDRIELGDELARIV